MSNITQAHQPFVGYIRLHDGRDGHAVSPGDMEVVHTRKLHLFIVDEGLRDYQHVHPDPVAGEPGLYRFTFTPKTSQPYSVWGECNRVGHEQAEHIKLALPHGPSIHIPATTTPSQRAHVGGIHAEWIESAEHPLRAGDASMVQVRLKDDAGNPITDLEEVMGAKAHMAGFSADGQHFIHTHPMNGNGTDPSILSFHIEPEQPGAIRFFLQLQRGGEEIYLPFTRIAQAAELHSDQQLMQHPTHAMQR